MFNWFHFLAYVLATASTPGPNTLFSLSAGSRLGFRKAFPFNLGIWAGFSIVMLFCAVFCSVLSTLLPKIKPVMLIIGAAYMLYLAWKTFRSGALEEKGVKDGFLSGLALQFINPKIYIYGIMSMQVYILPHFEGQTLILLGFALLLAFIGFLMTLCWSAFGSVFRTLFSKYGKVTNTVLALLLAWCAVSLFFE